MFRPLFLILFVAINFLSGAQSLPFAKLHTYKTGPFNTQSTGSIAYDRTTDRLYSTNNNTNSIDIISYANFSKPYKIGSIDLTPYISSINSVAVHFGIVAVTGAAAGAQFDGKLIFFDSDGKFEAQFGVGPKPTMVAFTPGGNKVLVANEGEPSDDYSSDPWGSVSILDVSNGFGFISQADVKFVYFDRLDTVAYDPMVHVYGNNGLQSPAEDLEPEYITISSNGTKAYVSLQENNALAIIDINTVTLDTVVGLGYKDFSITGMDGSDVSSSINIDNHARLYGLYQPNGLANYDVNGSSFIVSANEGSARNYSSYSEEVRVKNLPLNMVGFPNWPAVLHDTVIGRLQVTSSLGDGNNDGLYDSLFTFGGRSFSIWDENGQLVWDSGDEFEQTLALLHSAGFNSDFDDNSSRKSRSDDKGPQPIDVVIGEVDSTTYAFIALERMGGIMIYDITDPLNPQFEMYELNRDFSKAASDADAGDLGPFRMQFVKAAHNSRGLPLLYVSNRISGTITVYEMGKGVGLNEAYSIQAPSFYPNPSAGVFKTQNYGNYEVYDANGRVIQTVQNQNAVDLTKEAPGFYLIRSEDGTFFRIIKK